MSDNTKALALFIGGPLDGKRRRVLADESGWLEAGTEYEPWEIPAPPGRPPVRVFAPVGSTKEDVFWTLVVGFSAERAVAAARQDWEAEPREPPRYINHFTSACPEKNARQIGLTAEARLREVRERESIYDLMRRAGILKD